MVGREKHLCLSTSIITCAMPVAPRRRPLKANHQC